VKSGDLVKSQFSNGEDELLLLKTMPDDSSGMMGMDSSGWWKDKHHSEQPLRTLLTYYDKADCLEQISTRDSLVSL